MSFKKPFYCGLLTMSILGYNRGTTIYKCSHDTKTLNSVDHGYASNLFYMSVCGIIGVGVYVNPAIIPIVIMYELQHVKRYIENKPIKYNSSFCLIEMEE